MKYIKSINWIFTYKCNLKCTHCDIWKNSYKEELWIRQIKKIINSKIIQESYRKYWDCFDIAISWWEPLLIKNLKEILIEIDNVLPRSIHSISTNWTMLKRLIDIMLFWWKKWKIIRKINISIDWNEATHDRQRWINWSFKNSIKTIQIIRRLFPKQIIEIKLTITKQNYKEILFISKLADKLWVFFSFKPAENILNYTNQLWFKHEKFNEKEILEIERQIINNPYIIKQDFYINKYFFYNIPNYLRNWLWESKKICDVANDSITIMPNWDVYSCILMNKIWYASNNSIDKIWNWEEIEKQRQKIKNWICTECMLMCWSFKSKKTYGE